MKKFLVLCSLIMLASVPKIASATPVSYSVSGSLWVSDEGVWGWKDDLLWGNVEIDGEVDIHDQEAPDHIFYHFGISDYQIFTDGNSFAGNKGDIMLEISDNSIVAGLDWVFGHFVFGSFGGSCAFGYWGPSLPQGGQVDFINEGGASYYRDDPGAWQTLAPQIMFAGEVDLGGAQGRTGAILTLNKTTPVPEPSTLILLSTSIVGLAAFRKKFKKDKITEPTHKLIS